MPTQIGITLPVCPEPPQRGIDIRNVFVSKFEAILDYLHDDFQPDLNIIIKSINEISNEINQTSQNTLGYRDTTKTYRDESLNNKNLALTYKTGAELAYNNTQTLLSTLVIPLEATYNYQGANNKFAYKTDSFLNFKIGE
jgi:hypothetical protein